MLLPILTVSQLHTKALTSVRRMCDVGLKKTLTSTTELHHEYDSFTKAEFHKKTEFQAKLMCPYPSWTCAA